MTNEQFTSICPTATCGYYNVAESLCVTLDTAVVPLDVCLELYQSRLVYLAHLHSQCFKSLNTNEFPTVEQADLLVIQLAIQLTRQNMENAFNQAG